MKKLLLISVALTCFFSCKKDEVKPAQTAAPNDTTKYYAMGTYDIYVNSNYMVPLLSVEKGGSSGEVIYRVNNGPGYPSDTAQVHYKLNASTADKYKAYTLSQTVSGKMFDSNPVWNTLVIVKGSDTICNMTDSYKGTSSSSNSFSFDVK